MNHNHINYVQIYQHGQVPLSELRKILRSLKVKTGENKTYPFLFNTKAIRKLYHLSNIGQCTHPLFFPPSLANWRALISSLTQTTLKLQKQGDAPSKRLQLFLTNESCLWSDESLRCQVHTILGWCSRALFKSCVVIKRHTSRVKMLITARIFHPVNLRSPGFIKTFYEVDSKLTLKKYRNSRMYKLWFLFNLIIFLAKCNFGFTLEMQFCVTFVWIEFSVTHRGYGLC